MVLPGLVHRIQNLTDARAGDGPFLPLQLGHAQLGLNTVGFLPQRIHPAASSELALFQQPQDRRHPQPPQKR
ncbi:hypothetical protein [Streptomyces sp. NBC_00151]|uniref:hypothetical protein n=1 Tax=Streptomyces sp. NBC_00151 TaxID=2975669 RepID=UPI002DDB4633|nr:hypothetical protein [Streptomyces sp. NBC_00151]WRZ45553.1 hypothetical protein OG915_01450 [Streptomyces sp. NBC_00151]WRZ45578.1 hypothetical protein OG915_46115 [Streptomyces sp. NBC_00151]